MQVAAVANGGTEWQPPKRKMHIAAVAKGTAQYTTPKCQKMRIAAVAKRIGTEVPPSETPKMRIAAVATREDPRTRKNRRGGVRACVQCAK